MQHVLFLGAVGHLVGQESLPRMKDHLIPSLFAGAHYLIPVEVVANNAGYP